MLCPNCGHELEFHYQHLKDRLEAQYITERFELCPRCEYKRPLSRTMESGQVLFASGAPPSYDYEFERLFNLGRTRETSSLPELVHVAAKIARDICLIADNDRRYVEISAAAIEALGGVREAIVGRRIDEFFAVAPDISVPTAWHEFIASDDQFGTCELLSRGTKYRYRARANFLPGLHISVLRRIAT